MASVDTASVAMAVGFADAQTLIWGVRVMNEG